MEQQARYKGRAVTRVTSPPGSPTNRGRKAAALSNGTLGGFNPTSAPAPYSGPDRAPTTTTRSHMSPGRQGAGPAASRSAAAHAPAPEVHLIFELQVSLDVLDVARFLEALAQQLGLHQGRLTLTSATRKSPPPGCLVEVQVKEGSAPSSALVAENARGIMTRSQSQHRFIAGYAVVSIACQAWIHAI